MGDFMVRPILLFIFLFLLIPFALAVPPVATEFYGTITDKGSDLATGIIYANASTGEYCGRFTISVSGKYGLLSCRGDDPDTAAKEGAAGSEPVSFSLSDGRALRTYSDNTWAFGEFKDLNLTTFAVCGDAYCDGVQNETCSVCAIDCGSCNLTNSTTNLSQNISTNVTTNVTTNGSSSSSAEGSGTSSNGAEGGGGGGGASASGGAPDCKERWECGPWRPIICPVTELQNRTCRDLNACQTEKEKPQSQKSCRYKGTCFDSLLNSNETDIDCGGDLCPSCDIGQRCELDRDCITNFCSSSKVCSIPAPAAPVVARAKPPEISIPGLIIVCGNKFPWEILIPLLILSILPRLLADAYIKYYLPKYHKRYRTWSQEEKFKYQIKLRGRAFWLTIALIFVTFFVSIYAYLYFGCPDFLGFGLFMVIVLALLVFYTLYLLMKYYEFHEERTHAQLNRLLSEHYSNLKHLISIEDGALLLIERELLGMLKEFCAESDAGLAEARAKLSPLADVLVEVIELRVNKKEISDAEKKLNDLAAPILSDSSLGNLSERVLTVKRILSRLQLLSEHYTNQEQLKSQT